MTAWLVGDLVSLRDGRQGRIMGREFGCDGNVRFYFVLSRGMTIVCPPSRLLLPRS